MRLNSRSTAATARRGGYVIFAVLIVVVVLALVAYRFTESMSAEARATARASDDAQARLAAVSGLHYAAAVLSDRETLSGDLGGNPYDNSEFFQRIEVTPANAGKKAYFDIRSVAVVGGEAEARFGVTDEGGKLNINSLIAIDKKGNTLYNALLLLPNMTPEIADAIVDWVDADDVQRPAGAESAEYASLPNPYKAKNGPLNTLDELLLVRGVTKELLYGGDTNRNGVLDDGESGTDRGWSDYLTVYGRELNTDATGVTRVYLNGDDLNEMSQKLTTALGSELATYVLAAKLIGVKATDANGELAASTPGGTPPTPKPVTDAPPDQLKTIVDAKLLEAVATGKTKKINSLMDIMYSRVTVTAAKGSDPEVVAKSPLLDAGKRDTLLALLMDKTTTTKDIELKPRVNVNTAPREVLVALTGVTVTENKVDVPILAEADVDAILAARDQQAPGDPAAASLAWLVTAANLPPATVKRMEKYVTGSSMVYRVQSVGYFDGGGPVARMEAVIDTNRGAPRFLHVRDLTDLENPRGFDPNKAN